MENKLIYEKVETVPDEAQKQIKGGRLNGMTDIKPMWRIEKLTEVFGPCGLGWYAPITNREIIEGANDEKIAIVDINLFVNYKAPYGLEEDLWSEPITGTGGSSFVAKEKNGLYTSDECFKMAYTDALSVACKSLGMGAKVYWGDSKYNKSETIETVEEAKKYVITFGKKHPNETLGEIMEKDKGCHYRHRNIVDNSTRHINTNECCFTENFSTHTGFADRLTICCHIGYVPLLRLDLRIDTVLHAVRQL
jgi:hypothetical protein